MINSKIINIFIKIVMEEININLQVFVGRKLYDKIPTETLTFNFFYNTDSTFEDLLYYITPLFKTKICPCFIFYCSRKKINIDNKITILNQYIKKEGELTSGKIDFSIECNKCNCNEIFLKYFSKKKIEILKRLERLENELKNKINENNENFKTIKSLETDWKNKTYENNENIKKIKRLEIELKNKINENNENIKKIEKVEIELKNKTDENNENIKKIEKYKINIEKLENENKFLKLGVDKDFNTLDKLKEFGIGKDLKPRDTLTIDTKTNQIIGNNTENIFKENFEDFYDVIIDIQSVKDINKGWEIKMNERGKKNYELYKNEDIIKIGVIGNANKGKSFILSKISKINLPSGTSIRTEGLSIKYPELETFEYRKIALLDSAGLETPVLRENEEKEEISKELFREKSREKLITELFLQNYIIHNSDILILVVGIFTYSEQKLLNRIKSEIQRAKLNKPLYIIHNLKTYISTEQVKNYINKFLLKSATFKLVEGHKTTTKVEKKQEYIIMRKIVVLKYFI